MGLPVDGKGREVTAEWRGTAWWSTVYEDVMINLLFSLKISFRKQ